MPCSRGDKMDKKLWNKLFRENKLVKEAKLKTYYNKGGNLASKISGQEVWWTIGVEKGTNKVTVYGENAKGTEYEGMADYNPRTDEYTIISYKKI